MDKRWFYSFLLAAGLALGFWLSPAVNRPGLAQSSNRAGLVIQFGDGSIVTRCITFEGEKISGYEALEQTGLPLVAAFDPMGAAVCKIGDDGCPADNCFCGQPEAYWSYWQLKNGAWTYSGLGSSINYLYNGDVDGWAWSRGLPPPVYSFAEICAEPTATATVPPTSTPTTPPTATTTPTATQTFTPQPPTATDLPPLDWPTSTQASLNVAATQTPLPARTTVPSPTAAAARPDLSPTSSPGAYPAPLAAAQAASGAPTQAPSSSASLQSTAVTPAVTGSSFTRQATPLAGGPQLAGRLAAATFTAEARWSHAAAPDSTTTGLPHTPADIRDPVGIVFFGFSITTLGVGLVAWVIRQKV